MFYIRSNFDFSDRAKDWIEKKFSNRFEHNFFHDLDINQYQGREQEIWTKSIAGQELIGYLSRYGLDTSYYGICAFISNADNFFRGNPHVDVGYRKDLSTFEIYSRLNILVKGNPQDEMVWWANVVYQDPIMIKHTFRDINGRPYSDWAIPGETPDQRWEYLGEPNFSARNILTPSAFVKTDCAHTVGVSPGPRLIITVAFNVGINELSNRISQI